MSFGVNMSFWEKLIIGHLRRIIIVQVFFDPRYLPQYIYSYFLRPNTVPDRYAIPFQIKAYLPRLLSNAKQPEMIIRKIEGIYYNSEFEHITKSEAVRICLDVLQSGTEIVVKLSGQGGGKGVVFLANATEKRAA